MKNFVLRKNFNQNKTEVINAPPGRPKSPHETEILLPLYKDRSGFAILPEECLTFRIVYTIYFLTSCLFRNWTHKYSVSICKTDDSQDCRPGLAERCSRPRLKEGARRAAVGRIAPTGRTGPRAPAGSRHRISSHENVSSRTKCIRLRTLFRKNVLTRTNCTIAKRLKRYLPNVSNL